MSEEIRPSLLAAAASGLRIAIFITAVLAIGGIISGAEDPQPWYFDALERLDTASWLVVSFLPAVRLVFTRYIIDDDGVRVRVQILASSDQKVPWRKITALEYRVGLLDRILGLSRLTIVAYGRRGATVQLVGLRRDHPLRQEIAARMEQSVDLGALAAQD